MNDASASVPSQGTLRLDGTRLVFEPLVYPVAQIALDGWHSRDGIWLAPASQQRAERLLQQYPRIEATSALLAWLAASALPASSPVEQTTDLYPYQQRAVAWLAERNNALLAIAPGLGKSAIALQALRQRGCKRILVVCPLTLVSTWQREIARWWPEGSLEVRTYDALWRGTTVRVRKSPDAPWSYALDKPVLRAIRRSFDALLFDESVLLKSRSALRTRVARFIRRAVRGPCWMLSGSPTTRFYDDLWAQVHVLAPREYPSYWRFAWRYTLQHTTVWGTQIVANVPQIEPTLREDLRTILYAYSYTDLAREEPDKAIPEWTFETQEAPLPVGWWKLYCQMQKQFLADLPGGDRLLAPNALAKMVRLLQLASHPALTDPPGAVWSSKGGKLEALLELLHTLPAPVIIWTNFVATAKHLAHVLQKPCLIGDTTPAERGRIVDEFQAGQWDGLVAHPGVGRFGLTLTAARSAVYVERSYNGDDYYQSLHRLRRIGTTEPPRIVKLLATGPEGQRTIDHVIDRVLDYRVRKAQALTTALIRGVLDDAA